jgi:hypothetical protein
MARSLDLRIDVSAAVGLGETAEVALTVHLPEPGLLPAAPVVCFAKPGGFPPVTGHCCSASGSPWAAA